MFGVLLRTPWWLAGTAVFVLALAYLGVPALLEAYGLPYTFSDPLVCALTLHKGMAKHIARAAGVVCRPRDVFVEQSVAEFRRIVKQHDSHFAQRVARSMPRAFAQPLGSDPT